MKVRMQLIVLLVVCLIMPVGVVAQDNNEKYNQFDDQGHRQGIWYSYFRDGGLRYEGRFADDKPVGVFYYYFPEGGLRAELIHDSEESEYDEAVKATFYHKNREISSEGFYVNEERHGTWRYFNERGHLISENYYHHGEDHGVWKVYYSSGTVAEIKTFHYGARHGEWERYFENGKLNFVTVFEDDKLNGKYEVYNASGRVRVKGHYTNNQPDKRWVFYTAGGHRQREVIYKDGEIVRETIHIEVEDSDEPIRPGDKPFTEEELRRFGMHGW